MKTYNLLVCTLVINGCVGHSLEFGNLGSVGIRYSGRPWAWVHIRGRTIRLIPPPGE